VINWNVKTDTEKILKHHYKCAVEVK